MRRYFRNTQNRNRSRFDTVCLYLFVSLFIFGIFCFRVPDLFGETRISLFREAESQTKQIQRTESENASRDTVSGGYSSNLRSRLDTHILATRGSENRGGESGISDTLDLDKLAYAVAVAETGNCTRGVGITHNNCHGIKSNGKFIYFLSKSSSYHSFKLNWIKHYNGVFPTLREAKKWTGDDRPESWLNNVKLNY